MSLRSLAGALAIGLASAAGGAQAADGAALFNQHCAICHQPSGGGTVGLAPSLLGEHWAKLAAERGYLPTVLIRGLSGPIKLGSAAFNGSMPAVPQLDDESLAAIANHLRGLQGGAGSAPYTAADFAEARSKPGNPATTRALRKQLLGE